MKITKIENQKKNSERSNVFIDDNFAFGINSEIVYKYSLKVDREVDDDFIKEILLKEEQNKAMNVSLNFLSYRMRSEKEIRDKLIGKGYEDNTIEEVLIKLRQYNYLDDVSFGKSFMKDKQAISKFGSMRIRQELFKKGLSKETIELVLEECTDEDKEFEMALEIANKKMRAIEKEDKSAIKRKIYSLLTSKGFKYDIINKVFIRLLEESLDVE